MNRREFLRNSSAFAALGAGLAESNLAASGRPILEADAASDPGTILSSWQPGFLDIHHINTGRGNSTLILLPDGTSVLIDSGASSAEGPAMCAARPDSSLRPGQWIARYIARQLKASGRAGLDYALLTHLHGDHIGDVTAKSPKSALGDYKLTGISDVAEATPIRKLIDRGYPGYDYPAPVTDPTTLNYRSFIESIAKSGTNVEQVQVGSSHQIHEPHSQPLSTVRILAGNGHVWSGAEETSLAQFPDQRGLDQRGLDPSHRATENSCSIALRVNYGDFSYFTGGDLCSDTNYGRALWRDVETPAGKAAGPVSVSTCNHHGYFDATGPEFVRAVRPKVWILQSWHASHPAMSTLANLYSSMLSPHSPDVFCLGLHPAAALSCARFSDNFKSSQGHVLVRVAPGGAKFSVLVIEDRDESDHVKGAFGPYLS